MDSDELRRMLELTNEARDYLKQNEPLSAAKTLGNLGVLYRKAGYFAKALESSKAALSIFCQLGDRESEATELLLQGNTYGALEDFDNAINCHMQSLKISDELGHETLVAMNCLRVGLIMALARMYSKARVMLRYSALLYSILGQQNHLSDAIGAMEKFRRMRAFPSTPQEVALDKFFSARSSLDDIRSVVEKHPILRTPDLINLLDGANEITVGVHCVVVAIKRRVGMLRLIASE